MSETQARPQAQACPACGAQVDTADAEPLARISCPGCGGKIRVEQVFDHFVLVETLGVGGMGSVYKARDTNLDRFVALKILRKGAEAGHTVQLQQEARITAAVNDPHVVKVFSFGSDHDQFYLVMELVDHGTLEDLIEQQQRLPEKQVLQIAIQIATGLQAALGIGLIHRDVKPANILFADSHTAKIVDFGLAGAAEAREGAIWGTPYYVAPERLKNEREDFRSDIYSLGATLFHGLAGRPPIEGETSSASKLRELKNQPIDLRSVAPGVSRETARIIHRMLAPEPAARFSSYQELISELRKAAGMENRLSSRNLKRALVFTGSLFIIAIVVVGALFFTGKIGRTIAEQTSSRTTATPDPAFIQRYDAARRQLIAGKYEAASRAFSALLKQAGNEQPQLNWLRLHKGLAAALAGHARPARENFQAIEKDGLFSSAPTDLALARFFLETAKKMATPDVVPAMAQKGWSHDSAAAFAILLFALKDFQQSDFSDAAALLEQFIAAQPSAVFSWINDYKPLAQKYLDDLRLYDGWQKQAKMIVTNEQLTAALANLREIESKLHTQGALVEQVRSDVAELASHLSEKEKAKSPAQQRAGEKILEREAPAWAAAMTAYRKQIAAYDFATGRDAVATLQLDDTSLRQSQEDALRKAKWLVEWKNQLIDDLNHAQFSGTISDTAGVRYDGVVGATSRQLIVKNRYGIVNATWTKFSPASLLMISSSFIKGGAADPAHRQWLCAVFASETGHADAATQLAQTAAEAKPEYAAQLPLIVR